MIVTRSVKPLQGHDKVYTLHAEGLLVPSYIVGPKQARSAMNSNTASLTKRLERAIDEHQRLVALVDSNTPSAADMPSLKKHKLRAKDEIMRIQKQLSMRQSNSVSPLLVELGAGGFGRVLFGHCVQSNEEVAIKVASLEDAGSLWKENLVLNRLRNYNGFTKVYFFGKQNVLEMGQHVIMVMNVLGPSLDKLMQHTTLGVKGFSPSTVLEIASQMIDRLEVLSEFKIVHGDIQPGNMLMGRGQENSTLHLIDFGLSTLSTISEKDSKMFRGVFSSDSDVLSSSTSTLKGTLSYSSIDAMNGAGGSPRDDLESLAYSLAYLLCNKLPWTRHIDDFGDEFPVDSLREQVHSHKMLSTCDGLCAAELRSTTTARVISSMYAHARQLKPTETPDFAFLKTLIDEAAFEFRAMKSKRKFDWEVEGISWSSSDGNLKNAQY